MPLDTLFRLTENAGVLALGAILVFAAWSHYDKTFDGAVQQIALGILLGGISAAIVNLPIQGPFGSTFDTRAAPIVLAGHFLGPLGGTVAAAAAAAARYRLGGGAALGGVVSCILYLGAGLLARRLWGGPPNRLGIGRLVVLAGGATLVVLPSFFVNQSVERGLEILRQFWPVLFAGNVLGIVVLGTILNQLFAVAIQRDSAIEVERTSLLARHAASVGVWSTDFRSGALRWDAVAQRIMGASPDSTPYRPGRLRMQIHEDDQPAVIRAFEDAKSSSARFEKSFRIRRPDGDVRQLRTIADFIGPISGDPDRAVGVMIDETSQQELLRDLALHSAAIEAASCGITIADAAGDHAMRYVNDQFCEMTGYTRDEIVGRNCRFLNGDDSQPEALSAVRQALREHSECTVTLLNRRKDGTRYWVRLRLSPIRDAAGLTTHFLGIQENITGQVEARAALLAARDELRAIVQSAPSAILTIDEDLRITMANEAADALFGWARFELIGQPINVVIPEATIREDRKPAQGGIDHAHVCEGPAVSVARIVDAHCRDGRKVPIQVSSARFSAGGKTAVAITAHDISDIVESRRTAERAAAQLAERLETASAANEAKSRFLANMSHELRTPLNAIIGYADMMLTLGTDRFSPARVVEYISDIHRSGHHLLAIINDVLDISRIEHNAYPIECAPRSARAVFESALEIVRPLAGAKKIDIALAEEPDDIEVLCDARATRQCLLNMLSNAIKFSPHQTRIDVTVRREGPRAAFAVRDYGPGIASATLSRVGEPFLRVENPKLSSQEGTGLGLSIAIKLAEGQGGNFDIRNMAAPERGACATLWLPLAHNDEDGALRKMLVDAK